MSDHSSCRRIWAVFAAAVVGALVLVPYASAGNGGSGGSGSCTQLTSPSYVTSSSIAVNSVNNTTTATFKLNLASNKCITITFASYAAPAATFGLPQTLRAYVTQKYTHSDSGKTLTLGPLVSDPCYYQIDLAVGDVITNLSSTNLYGSRLVTSKNGGAQCQSKMTTSASPTGSLTIGGGSISDSAILSGLSAYYLDAGTVTFKLYKGTTASTCSTLVFTTTANINNGNGTYPGQASYTPTTTGYYNWIASYSGSAQNTAVSGSCGDAGESVHVVPQTPKLTSQASDPVTLGSGTIHDTITLSGGYNPTGTITSKLYMNSACTGSPVYTQAITVSGNGSYGSGDYTPTAAGTYYWSASYGGDSNNAAIGPTACPDPTETVTVSPSGPSLVTHVTQGSVKFNSPVSDNATLSGATNPTGTIHFALYGPSDATCSGSPVYQNDATVSGNGTYGSGPYTPTASGTYEWAVKYTSGDGNNTNVDLGCGGGDEVVQVGPPDRTPPDCALYQVINGTPKIYEVAVQDAGGLASIVITSQTNADVSIPDVSSNPTGQVIVTAHKHDLSKSGSFGLKVTDTSGNSTTCDPSFAGSSRHSASAPRRSSGASASGVTLRTDSRQVGYGADRLVTLSGSLPNAAPGQKVTLLTQGCGFTSMAPAATAVTGKGGAFHFSLTPVLTTVFAIRWGGGTSQPVRVIVAPDVALTRQSAGRYEIDVSTTNGRFLDGTRVVLQRLVGKHWANVGSAVLAKNSSEEAMTAVSSAVMAANTYGNRLRAVVPATACYAPSASGVITG